MSESILELIDGCKAGDGTSVMRLITQFQPRALEIACRVLSDPDLAEDAVQEAFIAVLQHLDDLREPEAFPGWFRQIVHTYACRIARSRKETDLIDESVPANEDSLQEHLENEELRLMVRNALDSLTPAGRETTEMFYLDQLSCAEIADVLRVPQGTVKRRLHDARKQLRSMLLGYIDGGTQDGKTKETDPGLPL